MKFIRAVGIAGLVFTAGCASRQPAPETTSPIPPAVLSLTPPAADSDPTRDLHALFDAEWQRKLRQSPEQASQAGDDRYGDRWTDYSLAAIEAAHEGDTAALLNLLEIDRDRLSTADQLNFDLFRQQLERSIEAYRYRGHLMPVNHLDGPHTADQLGSALDFTTVRDYEQWIARLQRVGLLIDQTILLMRAGIADGRTVPQVIAKRLPAQLDKYLVTRPETSSYYAPFVRMPSTIPAPEQARLRAAAQAAIRDSVVPAYRRLKDMVVREYLPRTRDSIAAAALPDGRDYYGFAVRSSTTTDLSPDAIHTIGLNEVARIRAEMEKIRIAVKFRGDLSAFFRHLRTDPRYFHRDGASLLTAYRDIAKRIDPELPKLFGKLPRQPYGVRAVPDTIAPDTTTAYYYPGAADGSRAGNFYANLYKPQSRPKWEQEALTAHEAVPGHHLQIALQQELLADAAAAGVKLPEFRQDASFTAFVEGWGLYSESLGPELGLYRDPYAKFGQLTYEMWRAVRLVVDTGMHDKGWTRDEAIRYFRNNTPRAELDIVNEIDRYIAWPGQALAYKIGELKIKELRARAETMLGPKFDLRGFHDTVLGTGAVPLAMLERNVDAWILQRNGGMVVKLRGAPESEEAK